MRQNSIQNRLQMISMEEYLEKRQKFERPKEKETKKSVCRQQELDAAVAMAELICLTEEHYSFESESSV